jgi:hypothetical protein
VTFYTVEKSKRRFLVMIARSTSHTSGHTMQGLERICETDSPQLVPWLLGGLEDRRGALFAQQLLEAAALAGEDEAILSKDIPPCLYCTGSEIPRVRRLWDELKGAIGHYSLANLWDWSDCDHEAAKAIEAAFAAFLAAREGKA